MTNRIELLLINRLANIVEQADFIASQTDCKAEDVLKKAALNSGKFIAYIEAKQQQRGANENVKHQLQNLQELNIL